MISTLPHLSGHLSLGIKFFPTSRKSKGNSLKFKKMQHPETQAGWSIKPSDVPHPSTAGRLKIRTSNEGWGIQWDRILYQGNTLQIPIRKCVKKKRRRRKKRETVVVHVLMYFNYITTCCLRCHWPTGFWHLCWCGHLCPCVCVCVCVCVCW